jgi:hypothetical protein
MPAKAGIRRYPVVEKHWTPAFAEVTVFRGGVNGGAAERPGQGWAPDGRLF